MLRYLTIALVVALIQADVAGSQTVRYEPSATVHQGREIVAIIVGSNKCGFSTSPKYMETIDPMLRSLRAQASARGLGFAAIGIAVDEPADSGLAYLRRVANFDELLSGRTWLNTGLIHYFPPDSLPEPRTPSLVILDRDFSDGVRSPRAMRTRRLFFAQGVNSIMAFVERGALLPELLIK